MPSPHRGRGTRTRGSEEEFVLFLQGIPAHCRWQELKDLVRQTALHIRQAVVYDDQHGFPTGLGQIIVKNEDEAWRTYHRLSTNGWEGQSLVVTLARTSSPTRPIAGPTKSPTCVIPPNYVSGYTTPPRGSQNLAVPASPMSPEPVISTSPTFQGPEYGAPMLSPMGIPHQSFLPIFTDPISQPMPGLPHSPALRTSFVDPLTFTIYPTYPMHPLHDASITSIRMNMNMNMNMPRRNPNSLPRNKSAYYNSNNNSNLPSYPTTHNPHHHPRHNHNTNTNNTIPRRTIFIQNLSAATTPKDLRLFVQEAGSIDQCEVPLDTSTGRCKGFARVTFRHADEAKRAVALYNNVMFLGAKIRVKIDRSIHLGYSLVQRGGAVSNSSSASSTTSSNASGNGSERSGTEKISAKVVVDRCQPLVVNGSGIGSGRQAVAI